MQFCGSKDAGNTRGSVMQEMDVPEAIPGSWECLVHQLNSLQNSATIKNRVIFMKDRMKNAIGDKKIKHRAIGVVHHPQHEHLGNYVSGLMPYRYNAFVYIDETTALHPLHIKPDGHEVPETYPFGV